MKKRIFTKSYDREGLTKGFQYNVECDGRTIAWDLSYSWAKQITNALNEAEEKKLTAKTLL